MDIDKNTNRCTWLKEIPNGIRKDRIVTGTRKSILGPGYYRYGTYEADEITIHDRFYTNNHIRHFGVYDNDFYKGWYGKADVILDRKDINIQFPKTYHCSSFVGLQWYLYDNLLNLYYIIN